MKDKILKSFSVESNGENIITNIVQTDKGIKIDIKGATMDIIVNDEIIYSKYDKEEYKYIPVNMRDFISRNLCEWRDGFIEKDKDVFCNIYTNSEYDIKIPKNKGKNKYVYISNWLLDYKKIQDYIEVPNGEENLNKLIDDIKEIGYDFVFMYDGNEYDNIYGLKFKANDFNKEKILKCMKLWEEYNNLLDKYIDKI